LDAAIISGLRLVAIHSVDSRFVDTDDPVDEIDVGDRKGDLLRRSQSGEKPELVIVPLRFTPIPMQGRDQELRVLHAERVDFWPAGFTDACAPEMSSWVLIQWPVAISKVESAFQHTDRKRSNKHVGAVGRLTLRMRRWTIWRGLD